MYARKAHSLDVEGDERQHIHQGHRPGHPHDARADGVLGGGEACILDAAPYAHQVLEGKQPEEEPRGVVAESMVSQRRLRVGRNSEKSFQLQN